MPIKRETLDAIVRTYVKGMTSIRGRRVHRLVMREFSRFDYVLPAVVEGRNRALFALAEDGSAAICKTDGRGPAVSVAQWARLDGATVTTFYDLLKDSLPIVSWKIRHPSFAHIAGVLTISAAEISQADFSRISDALRKLERIKNMEAPLAHRYFLSFLFYFSTAGGSLCT
jgi:hypothetical protein